MRRALPLVLGVLPVAVAAACYGATSMRVEVLTDFTCGDQPHAAIYNGGDVDPLAATTDCRASDAQTQSLGDLLFAPKDDRSATVTVKVSLAVGPNVDPAKQCKTSPDTCVFASRKFTYVEHESGHLTVRLYKDCLGKQCGEGQTCIQGGQCVSETVSCQGSNCGVTGETPFASTDAGGVSDSGAIEGGGLIDSPVLTRCSPPGGGTDFATSTAPTEFRTASLTAMWWDDETSITGLDMSTGAVAPFEAVSTVSLLAAGPDTPWSVRSGGSVYRGKTSVGTVQGTPTAMTIASAVGGTPVSAFIASGTSMFQVPAGAFTSPTLPTTVDQISHDATHLLVVTSQQNLLSVPFTGATTSLISTEVPLIASNGAVACAVIDGAVPGIYKINSGDNTVALLSAQVASTPSALAVDGTHVYWVEKVNGNAVLYRYPLAGKPLGPTTVPTPTLQSIEDIAPDNNLSGCIYYWTPISNGLFAVRAVPKP